VDVTDLRDEHRTEQRADARDGLHRGVARIAGQARLDQPGGHLDLEVEQVDDPAQRGDPGGVGRGQVQAVQQVGAGHAEQVTHRHRHAALGQDRVDLGLAP